MSRNDRGMVSRNHLYDCCCCCELNLMNFISTLYTELLWTITNQSLESKLAGGPRLLLDGSDSSKNRFMRDLTLWMGVGVMMMACMFSFFLSMRAQQGAFRSAPLGAPNRREAPRRLTLEQVQELVPEVNSLEIDVEAAEICSICLDEYSPCERLSELPCGHVFHSACVCKWLTERSSTCPLCKTDLMPDENEEEESDYVELREGGTQTHDGDDDDDSVLVGVFSFMERVFSARPRTWWRRRRQEEEETLEQESITDEEGVSQQPLLEHNDSDSEEG